MAVERIHLSNRIKILFLSRYGRLGASSRLRTFQYLPYLSVENIDITVKPLLSDSYLENLYEGKGTEWIEVIKAYFRRIVELPNIRRFDLVWIQYEMFPWLPSFDETILSFLGIPYVVDYDDAIFHNYDIHKNILTRTFLGRKISNLMRNAALVIVGNEYIGTYARKSGAKSVEYLPTVVNLDQYHTTPKAKNRVFTIGWIGSPSSTQYIEILRSALEEICRTANARLLLIGSAEVTLIGIPCEVRGWSEETEAQDILECDVGIMPLKDGPGEKGKCGYKIIQYMACGLPVVASPVGVNAEIIDHGVNGFLAETTAEWIQALTLLRENPKLRESMGESGRRKVEEKYSLQVTSPRLASLLHNVVRNS